MDGMQFDQWTKRAAEGSGSRRGMLRLGIGSGLAVLGISQAAENVAACRRTGKPCDKKKRNGGCCSGTCKKGKCRPTRGAAGCIVNKDFCANDVAVRCPNNPVGFCVLLDNGKPYCAESIGCVPCTSDANCTAGPHGKCLKTCQYCAGSSNGRACVYPRD